MIVTVSTQTFSHSTDPTAAAVTSGFRTASISPATRTAGEAPATAAPSAAFDPERLYPNLYADEKPARRTNPIVNVLTLLRRAAAAAR